MLTSDMQLKLIEKLIFASENQINHLYDYFFQIESNKSNLTTDKQYKLENNFFTGKILANSDFVGLWQNKDIIDSLEFAETLRSNRL